MTEPIEVHVPDYLQIAGSPPPMPIQPGPVHTGGSSPVDATLAAFGVATNLDLPETNAELAADHVDRTEHAVDAAQKFTANEADAVSRFDDVAAEAAPAAGSQQEAMGSAMQGINGAMQGITSALSGALGSVGRLPQGLMQAGQGALSPLMSAVQSLGKAGLGDATLASDIDPELGLGDGDTGGGGAGLGLGTTPASNLGPPPVPGTSTPTTPAGAMTTPGASGPTGGTPTGGGGGGGMMPMAPGGAATKGGKDDKVDEKRIAAPGVPNGQPVKGRTTTPPNVPVTKSVTTAPGQPGITPLKRIVDKKDPSS